MPLRYFFSLIFLLIFYTVSGSACAEDEIIGEVLGKPIFRNQLTSTDRYDIHYELQTLFVEPVLYEYFKKHHKDLKPTSAEVSEFLVFQSKQHESDLKGKKKEMLKRIKTISAELKKKPEHNQLEEDLVAELYYLRTELQPPGYDYAMFVLPHWKMQLHLYNNFGKGRILWQQRGYEAFDAMHQWLKEHEKAGDFKLFDAKTRQALYHHWTTMDHGAYLIDDPAIIQTEFIEPDWLQ